MYLHIQKKQLCILRLGTSAQLGPYDTKMKPSFTKPALGTAWLPRHGWNFIATPGSGMRQNFSEVLQKMYFFNFLIPMCLRTQLPLGLAWETSLSSACLEQMHHTWMFHPSGGTPVQGTLNIKLNFPAEWENIGI